MSAFGRLDQGLERLADARVLLIPLLISLQLFALDRLEATAPIWRGGAFAELLVGSRGTQLVLGVVRAFPPQPVGGPSGVRRLQLLVREREGAARRGVDRRELRRKQPPGGQGQRLPG